MPNFEKFMEAMTEDDSRKPIKTVPFKKEWKPLWDKLEKAKNDAIKYEQIRKRAKSAFWGQVEEDLDLYEDMRYNTEKNEIEIYAE